ncbi:hypothetical protein J7T55_003289 [Diaporthe amygdali]|uniref:uncharacterized protein n=1 Tax=Phomopsis amygdali TaxID=1214568 RepID=UPI0022FF2AD6|nr:uncharacterized protein J7T55_003289 [Diaporthe amygdali]KAJ0122773.1 hypothetical protein J7T55_003289 [Diaporthe amygdali]
MQCEGRVRQGKAKSEFQPGNRICKAPHSSTQSNVVAPDLQARSPVEAPSLFAKSQLLSVHPWLSQFDSPHRDGIATEQPHTPSIFDHAGIEVDVHQLSGILDWVDEEIGLSRLNDIHDWLWIVGRPMPPRPLHQQRLLNREIVITEKLDLHLDLRERALSLLFSYAALIVYESDFHIAKETHLIPEEVLWTTWRTAVRELLDLSPIYALINPRFHYGELRLSRLDKIYFFWKTPLRGYLPYWSQYRLFFQDNFGWLASSTVYIAVVLTAMQVGLATEALQSNAAFQSASYGFTIFSILGPLGAAGLVIVIFCYSFIGNWVATRQYSKQRLQRIEGR